MLNNSKWISYPTKEDYTCPVFRRKFAVSKKIKKATLKITSLGCYYAELNGSRIGDFILAPGWTYYKRTQMQTYDITNMIKNENEIKAIEMEANIIEKKVFLRITDYGKGIENVEEAMQPMFTTGLKEERSGMGFSFMEAFMDRLHVESQLGKGTVVEMEKEIGKETEF